MKKAKALVVSLALFAGPTFVGAQHAPPPEVDHSRPDPRTLTADDWRSDLAFLADEIESRHPRPYHSVSKEDFAGAVAALDEALPGLGYPETLVELSRLVALLGPGDGHSRLRLDPRFVPGQVPLRFWHFSEGLWIRSASSDHASLAGKRIIGLGGRTVDEALALVGEIVGADNDFDRRLKVPIYLLMPEILQGLGLASTEGLAIETATADGGTESHLVPFIPWPEGGHHSIAGVAHDPVHLGAGSDWVDMRPAEIAAPLYLSRPDDWYWMEELEEGRVVYAQFNVVGNQDDKKPLSEFFAELFEKAEPEKVEKLILDVRLNGGGNNFFNRPFIHGLIRSDTKNRRGHTFILTGRNTFSAAQNLVTKLSHETEAVFVGEPTGGRPNHFGDARRITLPKSGLDVSISTLYWQDGGPMDERPWVPPDIAVDTTGADYAAGRDPVLETILATDPASVGRPFEQTVTETFQTDGIDAALEAYRAYRADPAHRYADTEAFMNRAGYWLLGADMVEEAIRIFQVNVESYPESWNVHDSLGEALLKAGKIEEASKSYERSLELNPANESAAHALERLRAHGDGEPSPPHG